MDSTQLNQLIQAIDRITAIVTSSGGGVSNRVPYTGATTNVNLGSNTLTSNGVTTSTLVVSSTSSFAGNITISDVNIVLGTTTGTKIGTATTQKLGFWNATPVVQQTNAVASAAFVTNTSGITDGTATYGGYTVGQLVTILKLLGMIA